MALIDKFPTSGWKNPKLKTIVQNLLEAEEDFEQRKAPSTLSSMLLTLGNVYKDDAALIAQILTRPVVNTQRTPMKISDPNPASLALFQDPNCDTCPGAEKITPRAAVTPTQDVVEDPNANVAQTELDQVVKQVVGEETLVVAEEHEKPTFGSPEEVWKFFSGDLVKLQEAASAAGVKNAKYDQVPMSLAKKIYNAQ